MQQISDLQILHIKSDHFLSNCTLPPPIQVAILKALHFSKQMRKLCFKDANITYKGHILK